MSYHRKTDDIMDRVRKTPAKKSPDETILMRILGPFKCAWRGIEYAVLSQQNMRIHVAVGTIMIVMGVYFGISRLEWMALCFSVALVLMAEMMNTAIEVTIDLVTKKTSVRAMLAKDIAAGAVLVLACNAIAVGCLIFYDKVHNLLIGG